MIATTIELAERTTSPGPITYYLCFDQNRGYPITVLDIPTTLTIAHSLNHWLNRDMWK